MGILPADEPPPAEPISTELAAACSARQGRLRDACGGVGGAGVDGLLIGHDRDIRYLTGFSGEDSLLLMPCGSAEPPVIITDTRHDEVLNPWRERGVAEVVMGTRHRLEQSVAAQCDRHGVGRLGIQAEHLPIAGRRALADAVGGVSLVETEGLVRTLRMRKDALEIAAIERAASIHQDAMRAALGRLRVGMTELELCAALEYEMKVRGASGPSFGTMVASGPRSSIIHYETSAATIEEGVLLVDWGAVADGYCSDMTRTFAVGRMPDRIREIHAIVLEAQQAAIDACAPGRRCAEIDAVARDIITAAGYGEHFGHGLGHGLGLDIHEDPYFNELSTDVVLAPGMVMTVEPGIYIPGAGGVRIEDDVVVTDDGCRVLTSFPKDPEAAAIVPKDVCHA